MILADTIHDPFNGTLYEGLINVVPIEKALELLDKYLINYEYKQYISIEQINRWIIITFVLPNIDLNLQRYATGATGNRYISAIIQLMNNLGYFPSGIEYIDYLNKKHLLVYNGNELRNIIATNIEKLTLKFEQNI